jgi:hypothetical protein
MFNSRLRLVFPVLLLWALPFASMAQGISVSVNLAPPELPVYEQPAIPSAGYLFTPGYWAWADGEYYWVPGTWVLAPQPGYLWTPGYWGSNGGVFLWNEGYWGTHVGFYGGVNYGFGYGGSGFQGGYWRGGHLFYNRSVVNFGGRNITNVYSKTVVNNVTVNRVSYNGGSGGVRAQPTANELAAASAHHLPPTRAQQQQVQTARSNPALRASANHGNPPIAATARAGAFSGKSVIAAKGASPASEPAERKAAAAPVAHKAAPAQRKVAAAPVQRKATAEPAEREAAPVEHKAAAVPVEHKAAAAPADHKVAAAPAAHKATAAPAERKVAAAPAAHKAPAEPAEHKDKP